MIKKREKNRKLRGSVLLTVVMVMSMLIIFLISTLTLAAAANNRAHVNYSTAQTQVTSRTVVDAAIKAMELDENYANVVSSIEDAGDAEQIPVALSASVADAGKYGTIEPVQITYEGSKKFYNEATQEWITGKILKFSSTVSMAGVKSTTAAYIVKNDPDIAPPSSGKGAGFVTTAGANLSTQSQLYGGSYISLPRMVKKADGMYYPVRSDGTVESYFYDYTDPSTYRNFPAYGSGDTSTYFTMDNSGGYAECDLYVNNNMYIKNWSGFIFPGKGTGITVWGDMVFSDRSTSHYISKVTGGDLEFNEVPYIYVDGKLHVDANQDLIIGDISNPFPLNVFCGSIGILNEANKTKIAGDLYCMDESGDNFLGGNGGSELYNWTCSVVNKLDPIDKNSKLHGSVYSAGKMRMKNIVINGDARIANDCTIDGDVTIKGDLVVKGNLTINGNLRLTGNLYVDGTVTGSVNKESSYTKVPTVEGAIAFDPAIHERIDNERRYYVVQNAVHDGQDNWGHMVYHYKTLSGNRLTCDYDDVQYLCYEWKTGKSPADLNLDINSSVDSVDFMNNFNAYRANPWENVDTYIDWNNAYYVRADGSTNKPMNGDGNSDYFYIEKDYDGNLGGKTDEAFYIVEKDEPHDRVTGSKMLPTKDGAMTGTTMADFASSHGDLGYSADSEYVWYNGDEVISKAEGDSSLDSTPHPTADYKDSKVYPRYAEKLVLLGEIMVYDPDSDDIPAGYESMSDDELVTITRQHKQQVANLKKQIDAIKKGGGDASALEENLRAEQAKFYTNTQVVKTMSDVLDNIANPYENVNISTTLQSMYDVVVADNDKIYHSSKEVLEKTNMYAKFVKTGDDGVTTINAARNSGYYTAYTLDSTVQKDHFGNQKDTNALYINENCVIDGVSSDNDIIINPGSANILVVIRDLTMNNKAKIMVDDTQGGTVNFYIENKNATAPGHDNDVQLKASGITSCKYQREFEKALSEGKTKWAYGSGTVPNAFMLDSLGKPKLNIYAGTKTNLQFDNAPYCVANILSPNLGVKIPVGVYDTTIYSNLASIDSFLYNSSDILNIPEAAATKFYVFGCCNAKDVANQNDGAFLYITDSSNIHTVPPSGDAAFQYRVLYYDEY